MMEGQGRGGQGGGEWVGRGRGALIKSAHAWHTECMCACPVVTSSYAHVEHFERVSSMKPPSRKAPARVPAATRLLKAVLPILHDVGAHNTSVAGQETHAHSRCRGHTWRPSPGHKFPSF